MRKNKKTALVLGAGGFIGSHTVTKLKELGYYVRGCDLKNPEFGATDADEFFCGDLRDLSFVRGICDTYFDLIFQFAADMGGAGYIFTGDHDADIMSNSAMINLNILYDLVK